MPKNKKSQSEPYLVIPRRTIRSSELNSLSFQSRWIYVVFCTEWKRNNGNEPFMFTYDQMIKIVHCDRRTMSRSIKELTNAGFMEKINHGGLLRNPNTYKLNELHLFIKQEHHEPSGRHGSNN